MGEAEGYLPYPDKFETMCIHHAKEITKDSHKERCQFMAPLIISNFCKGDTLGGSQQYLQGRLINPTRAILENLMCVLNKGKHALVFSSGMGAITAVLGLLKCGDEIVCHQDVYGGTNQILSQLIPRFGLKTSFADFCDPDKIVKAITSNTKLFWMENPSNPKLDVIDLCRTAEIAKEHNIITSVDNSFLTPFLQRPLELGFDIVMHAVTKFLNGHSDVIMGAVTTSRDDLFEKLQFVQRHYGHVPSPFDCFQVIRGIKTLPLRLKRHHTNSLEVAKFLMEHPKVEEVIHPGHPCHPCHELFKSQTSGHCGMIAFYVKGGAKENMKFMKNLKVFATAVSMGGYESLVQPPFFLSHKGVSDELKKINKITPNLVRMAVGIEDYEDLIADLDQSLNSI